VRAHTNIQIKESPKTLKEKGQVEAAAYGPPFSVYLYETPASIACVYDLLPGESVCNPNVVVTNPKGGSRAIAIVDAFDDPNAYANLATYSAQFGLAAINPESFQVIYAPAGLAKPGTCKGKGAVPPVDPTGGWEVEESLDEIAHGMAPEATLYLVEAQSNDNNDLFCAVTLASKLVRAAGGGEVSMSWGEGEYPKETTDGGVFTIPNVVYFASAGDGPGTFYPSASPNVVSVGGTTLSSNLNTGNFLNENVWQETGGGASFCESIPSYQSGISTIMGTQRGVPDVSSDANPYTRVWVLDDFDPPAGCTPLCWYTVGGTSVSSPTWAGIVYAAGSFAVSTNAEHTLLYGDKKSDFRDITYGNCGPYMFFLQLVGGISVPA